METVWGRRLFYAHQAISLATFIFLTFFNGYRYTWWNWIVAVPVNLFLSEIWPIYWLVLRPFMG